MKLFVILSLVIFFTGCASPYIPPTETPPSLWSGEAKFKYQKSTVVVGDEQLKVGDIALKGQVNFSRMAIVSEMAETNTAFGGRLIFPKGMPVWGVQYTNFVISKKESDVVSSQAENNPIEWCGVLPKGSDGEGESPELYCLFWEGSNKVRYIKGYFGKNSIQYMPSSVSRNGMLGPVPKLIEKSNNFEISLESELTILKINKAGVKLQESLKSSGKIRKHKIYYWKWSDLKKIHEHMGLRFRLIPSKDFTSFKIQRVKTYNK